MESNGERGYRQYRRYTMKLYKQDKRLGGTGLPPEVEKTWNVQPRKKAGKISHN